MEKNTSCICKRSKAYKAASPTETISRIRRLLEDEGLFARETYSKIHSDSDSASCRIVLDNDSGMGELEIGTNGKGMNNIYSLASAYAELMERLQNNLIMSSQVSFALPENFKNLLPESKGFIERLERENLKLDFRYVPDEKICDFGTYCKNDNFFVSWMKKCKEITSFYSDNDKIRIAPFYDMLAQKTVELPINIIRTFCGSNGMCAGNTPLEAIIKGTCEIFERYAINMVYQKDIAPPDIPREYFEGTEVLKRIESLEEKGRYSLLIKDFSLGLGLPVVGLVGIDKEEMGYWVSVGSDPSAVTALERCLTEAYQGRKGVETRLLTMTLHKDPFAPDSSSASREDRLHKELSRTILNGSGFWPNSLFCSVPSYEFKGFEHPESISDEDDFRFIVSKVKELGAQIYVRDASWLGFPSYYVNIPGMSEIIQMSNPASEKIYATLLNLRTAKDEDLEHLARFLEKEESISIPNIEDLMPLSLNKKFNNMSFRYFMTLLHYRTGNEAKAYEYLNKHIEDIEQKWKKKPESFRYLHCFRDFLKLSIDGYNLNSIEKELSIMYGKEFAEQTVDRLTFRKNIFNSYKVPSCFNCAECQMSDSCRYIEVLKYLRHIQDIQNQRPIDQNRHSEVFEPVISGLI